MYRACLPCRVCWSQQRFSQAATIVACFCPSVQISTAIIRALPRLFLSQQVRKYPIHGCRGWEPVFVLVVIDVGIVTVVVAIVVRIAASSFDGRRRQQSGCAIAIAIVVSRCQEKHQFVECIKDVRRGPIGFLVANVRLVVVVVVLVAVSSQSYCSFAPAPNGRETRALLVVVVVVVPGTTVQEARRATNGQKKRTDHHPNFDRDAHTSSEVGNVVMMAGCKVHGIARYVLILYSPLCTVRVRYSYGSLEFRLIFAKSTATTRVRYGTEHRNTQSINRHYQYHVPVPYR
mmetsp:Transcript_12762/g.26061  ORF Transcript_12762/g.26061 Transcript_12762/m.26061 type:complete len:289 (+) Transcript_12762:210-1076(+)